MKRNLVFLLPLLAAAALPALAQENAGPLGDRDGKYVGSGEGELSAKFTHIEGDVYAVDLETVVPISDMGGCAGGISGEMIMSKKGGNLFVENEDYDPALGDNPINTPFAKSASTLKMAFLLLEERDGCMQYHGASCSFTGQLIGENAAG